MRPGLPGPANPPGEAPAPREDVPPDRTAGSPRFPAPPPGRPVACLTQPQRTSESLSAKNRLGKKGEPSAAPTEPTGRTTFSRLRGLQPGLREKLGVWGTAGPAPGGGWTVELGVPPAAGGHSAGWGCGAGLSVTETLTNGLTGRRTFPFSSLRSERLCSEDPALLRKKAAQETSPLPGRGGDPGTPSEARAQPSRGEGPGVGRPCWRPGG